MKKVSFGDKTMLYPYPCTILAVDVNDKVNFMAVGYIGVVNGDPPMLAMGIGKMHYSMEGIKKGGYLGICIASEDMIVEADYVGMNSGRNVDKSKVFEVFRGENNAPLIKESPVCMECKVVDILGYGGMDYVVICEVKESYVDEYIIDGKYPNIKRMNPLIFSMYENRYFGIGDYKGDAWSIGSSYDDGQ